VPAIKIINTGDGYLIATFLDKLGLNMVMQLLKTDFNGVILWHKEYEGLGNAIFYDFLKNRDGSYMLLGASGDNSFNLSFPEAFVYLKTMLLKIDGNGNKIWTKYTGSDLTVTAGKSIVETETGWAVAAVSTTSHNGTDKMLVQYFDKKGELIIK
jgi:hypothetical protein